MQWRSQRIMSHTLKLVIFGEKLTSVKKFIAGGQTTVHSGIQKILEIEIILSKFEKKTLITISGSGLGFLVSKCAAAITVPSLSKQDQTAAQFS
jgi:hypothetical protein